MKGECARALCGDPYTKMKVTLWPTEPVLVHKFGI